MAHHTLVNMALRCRRKHGDVICGTWRWGLMRSRSVLYTKKYGLVAQSYWEKLAQQWAGAYAWNWTCCAVPAYTTTNSATHVIRPIAGHFFVRSRDHDAVRIRATKNVMQVNLVWSWYFPSWISLAIYVFIWNIIHISSKGCPTDRLHYTGHVGQHSIYHLALQNLENAIRNIHGVLKWLGANSPEYYQGTHVWKI